MRPNAWQRSCVGKACHKKKPMGQRGGVRRRKEGGRVLWVRGAVAAEEASVFPQERLCRAKWTWKGREMGKRCREVFGAAAAPRAPLATTGPRLRPVFGSVHTEPCRTTTISAGREFPSANIFRMPMQIRRPRSVQPLDPFR